MYRIIQQKFVGDNTNNGGKFTVLLNELAYHDGKQIFVTDIAGRKIYSINIEKNRYAYTLNIGNAKGIYIVQVLNNNKKAIDSQKITIK